MRMIQRSTAVTLILFMISLFWLQAVSAQSEILLEKSTNGQDADAAPGPGLVIGDPVTWAYRVTNIGSRQLASITVTDDVEGAVTCPATSLAPGESMTCTLIGTVQSGQYANLGTATGLLANMTEVMDTDPSHYLGQPAPAIDLEKATDGFDADTAPGPILTVGNSVTWTYVVSNVGPETLTGVQVSDDREGPATCPIDTLAPGESMTCTLAGIVQPGQYANLGSVTATLPDTTPVTANDSSHYFGQALALEKMTNGADADLPPGPVIAVGDPITWTYDVSNPGPATVTNLAIVDDQGVVVTCPVTTLAARESTTCTGSGFAVPGQYVNLGTATATAPGGAQVSGSDVSHYFGDGAMFDFGDAPDPTYPTLLASDGARHLPSAVLLGDCVDYEVDGQPTASAEGDDLGAGIATTGSCASPGADEDGVVFGTPLVIGSTADIAVDASAPCTLSAWIDFNQDGDWMDAGEELFPGGQALAAGVNPLSFPIPAGALEGNTPARFRCTTDGPTGITGEASDGEVEDYSVLVEAPVPDVAASKTAALAVDVDNDGQVEPGDTLLYTIAVTNAGTGDATSVVFSDTPGANTTLVSGSVTTTAGTVTTGNGAGDTSVVVAPGSVAGLGGSVTITFQVVIDNPVPADTFSVSNQGLVSGGNFADVLTDDPAVGGLEDPTVTALNAAPEVRASKIAALIVDGDGDGRADQDDVIRYTIIVENTGNADAAAVVLSDTPDANTMIVAGSVSTTQGVITSGNSAGDSVVTVELGTLPGVNGTATIVFDVRVPDRLSPAVESIVNTATITGTNFPATTSDDPSLAGANDPTAVPASHVPTSIPTLEWWSLLLLIAILGVVGLRRLDVAMGGGRV